MLFKLMIANSFATMAALRWGLRPHLTSDGLSGLYKQTTKFITCAAKDHLTTHHSRLMVTVFFQVNIIVPPFWFYLYK